MKKATKAKTKMNPDLPEFVDQMEIKHAFSDAEKGAILLDLTIKQEEREGLVAQAKSSARQWKARIEEADLIMKELSAKGRNGFEMRPTDVRVVLDKKNKKKHLCHADTGEFIDTVPMTDADFERLPLDLTGKKNDAKEEDEPEQEELLPDA